MTQQKLEDLPYIKQAKTLLLEGVNKASTLPHDTIVRYEDIVIVRCVWSPKSWKVLMRLKGEDYDGQRYHIDHDTRSECTIITEFTVLDAIDTIEGLLKE